MSQKNLRMFRQLCGDGALKNVCIATTNWDRLVSKDEGDMREQQLRDGGSFFKPLLDGGAQLVRHDKGITSAQSIVNYLIHKDPTKLLIQEELDDGLALEETSSGAVIHEEIIALQKKHAAEMLALKQEMEAAANARHSELLAELEEERRTMEAQRRKMEKDLEDLKTQARSDKAKNEADIRDLKKQIMEEERKADELHNKPGSGAK